MAQSKGPGFNPRYRQKRKSPRRYKWKGVKLDLLTLRQYFFKACPYGEEKVAIWNLHSLLLSIIYKRIIDAVHIFGLGKWAWTTNCPSNAHFSTLLSPWSPFIKFIRSGLLEVTTGKSSHPSPRPRGTKTNQELFIRGWLGSWAEEDFYFYSRIVETEVMLK